MAIWFCLLLIRANLTLEMLYLQYLDVLLSKTVVYFAFVYEMKGFNRKFYTVENLWLCQQIISELFLLSKHK